MLRWIVRLYPVMFLAFGFLFQRWVLPFVFIRYFDAEVELFAVYYVYIYYAAPAIIIVGIATAVAIARISDINRRSRALMWWAIIEAVLVVIVLTWLFPAEIGGALKGTSYDIGALVYYPLLEGCC